MGLQKQLILRHLKKDKILKPHSQFHQKSFWSQTFNLYENKSKNSIEKEQKKLKANEIDNLSTERRKSNKGIKREGGSKSNLEKMKAKKERCSMDSDNKGLLKDERLSEDLKSIIESKWVKDIWSQLMVDKTGMR